MAFQTNVFRDGEWVTETVNLHAVLKSQKAAPKGLAKQDPLKPPPCGLLTTTLVESARANSILPARIRSSNAQDVAFVGVSATAPPLALLFFPALPVSRLVDLEPSRTTSFSYASSGEAGSSSSSPARVTLAAASGIPASSAPVALRSPTTGPTTCPPNRPSNPNTQARLALPHQVSRVRATGCPPSC